MEKREAAQAKELKALQEKYDKLIEELEAQKDYARVGKKLLEMKVQPRYRGVEDSKSLYMLVSSICPGASPEAISQFAPAILAAFFADLDLMDEVDIEVFAKNTPSASCIRDIIALHRQLQMEIVAGLVFNNVPIFASFDKGHRNNSEYLVKELSWWDDEADMVRTIRLQSDGAGNTSEEAALSWDLALTEIDFGCSREILLGRRSFGVRQRTQAEAEFYTR